jgi:Carboxypeptidase regulatory-like domain/TonB dependent receptor
MSLSVLCVSGRTRFTSGVLVLVSIVGILLLSASLFAQSNQGRIQGTVRDQSGGIIAGATVTVTDVLKGVTRTLTTDEAGEYAAPNLDPSTYRVRVEYKGFRTYERQGLDVGVGQEAKIDITMQTGEQNQTVTVTEAIPLVETTSATLTGNIETQKIADLPLNGRNFVNLLTLRPGYVNSPGGGGGNQAGMGMRPGDSMFLIDGLAIYEWGQGQQLVNGYAPAGDAATLLPIDAIQEFNIQQNPKAELGWKPGVNVNLGLKAGTNSFHGTAYAFGRDGAWDALNFFQDPTQAPPPLSFEQYGATAGGPIIKDKLFWFVGYEAQLLNLGITTPIKAPESTTGGGFTNSIVDACNTLTSGRNSVTALSATLAGLPAASCTPLPASSSQENVFVTNPNSSSFVVPAGLATLSDVNSTYNGVAKVDYHANDRNTFSGMFFIGDGSGTWDDNPSVITSAFSESLFPVSARIGSGSWTFVPNSAVVNEFKVGYTHYLLPFLAVDHNANPAAPWGIANGIPTGYNMNTGVTNPNFFGFPRVNITGFTQLGGNWPKYVGPNTNTEFLDHMSYLHGKHAFKFGGEFTIVQSSAGATSNAKGKFNFKSGGSCPLNPIDPNSGNPFPCSALENFLLGNVGSGSSIFEGDPVRNVHTDHFAAFFQDDYRVTPRITVNLGVRYELATVLQDINNQLGNFDPNSPTGLVQVGVGITSPYNPDHRDWSPRVGIAWDLNGNQKTVIRAGASLLYEFVPFSAFMNSGGNAVGLGKVPTGALLCQPEGTPAVETCVQGSGNIAAATISPAKGGLTTGWKSDGAIPIVQGGQVTCSDTSPCSTASFARNLRTPYVITWNFDLQRAITSNLSLDLAYLGNHGVKLYGTRDINSPAVGAGYSAGNLAACSNIDPAVVLATCNNGPDQAELGPFNTPGKTPYFPYLQYILQLSNMYRSHYNAVQATLTQRTSHGLSFTAAYTYSHATDDVSQNFGSSTPLNNLAPDASNYGNSDYDIRHRFTFEATYALPGLKSPGQILQGWVLNSILTLQTATPWAVQDLTNDFSGTNEVNNPNTWGEAWNFSGNAKDFTAVPGTAGIPFFPGASNANCVAATGGPGSLTYASLLFNGCYATGKSVLTPPAYGTFGNVGKNIFRDTPFRNWDVSVQKNWKFKERLNVQFRAEFFNVLNHPLFGDVGAGHLAANDPSQGTLAAASATPDQASGNPVLGSGSNRDIQLGLKLIF